MLTMSPREAILSEFDDAQKLVIDGVIVTKHAAKAGELLANARSAGTTDPGADLREAIGIADDRVVEAPNTDSQIYWREVANILRGVAHSERCAVSPPPRARVAG